MTSDGSRPRSRHPRVLVIGLDGATFWLIDPWVKAGLLPGMARLMREGARMELRSTIPYVSGPAWATFATGKNPGKHGYFDFARRKPGSYDVELINGSHVGAPAVWDILGAAGKKTGLVNFPVSYPPKPIHGLMVTGMLTPGLSSRFTWPDELREELLGAVPGYMIEPAEASADRVATKASVAARVRESTERRYEAGRYLMGRLPDWDLFVLVFTETDRVMTYLWDDMDPAHPRHDAAMAGRFANEIQSHYRRADAIIDEIVRDVVAPDGNTVLLVVSDHGFGGVHDFFFPNVWLERSGYLALRGGHASVAARGMAAGRRVLSSLGLAHAARSMLRRAAPGWGAATRLREYAFTSSVDWGRTRAFWASDNGISINVRGREPEGIVAPGPEYEALRDRIAADLLALRDPRHGEPVAAEVLKREEIYSGPFVDFSPDLRVVWHECAGERRTHFSAGEPWSDEPFGFAGQTGDHARDGILLACGAGVRPGGTPPRAYIADVAATILWLQGEPVPSDFDGRVLLELFEPSFVSARPVRSGAPSGSAAGPTPDLSDAERKAVEERLRGLGYIG